MTAAVPCSIEERETDFDFEVSVSYMQLYMDHVYDLLAPKSGSLPLRQASDNVAYVDGLSTHVTSTLQQSLSSRATVTSSNVSSDDVHEVLALMEIGARSKVVAANRMNARSSRSHTLFQVTVKRTVRPACPSLQLPDIILKVPAWVNRFVTHCLNPRRFHRGQMLVPWRESYLHSSRSWTWRAPSGRQKPSLVRRHAPLDLSVVDQRRPHTTVVGQTAWHYKRRKTSTNL